VLLKIGEIIASHGAEIAFPTTTVHIPAGLNLPPGQVPPEVPAAAR
jgi:hypothetical protein